MTPDLKDGDELTAEWLNDTRAIAAAGGLTVDGSSGMAGYQSPALGNVVHTPRHPPRWVKVLSGGTGGVYSVKEQIPTGVDAWDDGLTFSAREPNGDATLAASGTTARTRCLYNVANDEWNIEAFSCP